MGHRPRLDGCQRDGAGLRGELDASSRRPHTDTIMPSALVRRKDADGRAHSAAVSDDSSSSSAATVGPDGGASTAFGFDAFRLAGFFLEALSGFFLEAFGFEVFFALATLGAFAFFAALAFAFFGFAALAGLTAFNFAAGAGARGLPANAAIFSSTWCWHFIPPR